MTMLVKEEEVATTLTPASTEVISQPVLQQETISIKSAYLAGYFFTRSFIHLDKHLVSLVVFLRLVIWYVIHVPYAISQS